MSSLECLGNSFASSQKQLTVKVTSADAVTHRPNDTAAKKRVTDKPRRSLPAHALPRSVQVSNQESQRSGSVSGEALKTEGCSPKESINTTPRVEEQAQSTTVSDEKVKIKPLRKAHRPDSAVTGEMMHAPPPIEHLPSRGETNEEEEQTEVEDDGGEEDLKAPVELIIKFFRAVMDRDYQLASRLCQMILVYEPENPEATEFLPLIQKKLLEEQETEQSNNEDDDGDDDAESDEESSASSSSSSSASDDDDDDDDEEERHVNRHKLCPSSLVSP